ncbi:MAG TPA: YihY/virulence factor BrkB family protein, partial [Blastocatellia bacterium]|nr:YihY/virulence factor BrkB family protein [Blastocatellia bacterium]
MSLRKDILPLLQETWDEFWKDEAGQCGAALAYYAMFSIFPLLLLLLAALGFVLRYWDAASNVQQEILAAVSRHLTPQLSETLREMLAALKAEAGPATGIGFFTLLLGASAVFQQLDTSFKKIWRTPETPPPAGAWNILLDLARARLFAFGMVLVAGLLLLFSLALTGITQALLGALSDLPIIGGAAGYVFGLVVTLALNTFIFALLFKYLPGIKVQWADVLPGAFVTAVIWEVGKRALALYIGYSSYVNAYGAVGTSLVLMA